MLFFFFLFNFVTPKNDSISSTIRTNREEHTGGALMSILEAVLRARSAEEVMLKWEE